jgi:hypothetical protein
MKVNSNRNFNIIGENELIIAIDGSLHDPKSIAPDDLSEMTNRLTFYLGSIPMVMENQEEVARKSIKEAIATRKQYLLEKVESYLELPQEPFESKLIGSSSALNNLTKKDKGWVEEKRQQIIDSYDNLEENIDWYIGKLEEKKKELIAGLSESVFRDSIEDIKRAKEALHSIVNNEELFPEDFQELLMLTDVKIIVTKSNMPNITDFTLKNGKDVSYLSTSVINAHREGNSMDISRYPINLLWDIIDLKENEFVRKSDKENSEFKKEVGRPRYLDKGKNVSDTNGRQRISYFHGIWNNSGLKDKARKDFPLLLQTYNRFMNGVEKVIDAYFPYIVEQPTLEEARLNKDDDLRNLVENVEKLLEQPLNETPPFDRFKASLVPQPPKHPIKITLGNAEGEVREVLIATNEPYYDRAIELKQGLQSHFLSKPNILAFRSVTKGGERSFLMDDPLPSIKPDSHNLYYTAGFYGLKVNYSEGEEKYSVSFPIGLMDKKENTEQAEKRAEIILEHLEQSRTEVPPIYITKSDTMEHLINELEERSLPTKWEKRERIKVGGFEERTDINFPPIGNQETKLAPVIITFEDGGINPTWRLDTAIEVDGVTVKDITTNLHIRNGEAAEERAVEIVKDVIANLERLGEANPEITWSTERNGTLTGRHVDMNLNKTMASSEVLQMVIDNSRNYKSDLSARLISSEQKDNKITFKVGAFRGNLHSLNEQVNYPKDRPIEMTFTIDASNKEQIGTFVSRIDKTFRAAAEEKYSSKIVMQESGEIDKAKAPAGYSPITANNMLKDSIKTHLEDFPAIQESVGSFASKVERKNTR